ncbi:hypothetical protein DSY4624 [Desulfitobacterium hafniense Y51]|uniref:Uncharacterized protein n=1 Tax=Desulfitobacterium hafniense (strain Y51) TaxID=138119 RepID=Q24NH9_DESHY|nr:hypothetical protein DSY4624 [Desulfitobacterium hafniense Y51]
MRNKILIVFLVLLAFLAGVFIPKGIAKLYPPVWSQSLPASQRDPVMQNTGSSSASDGNGAGGMWYSPSPMNPNYNPRFDWYTLPKDQCENGRNDGCW